jgi:acyl carrier protein
VLKIIQKIVYEVTGKKNVSYDTDFVKDLELNSFDIMNLVCAFEEYFGVSIPNRDVWHLHKVRDVIAYAEKKGIKAPVKK